MTESTSPPELAGSFFCSVFFSSVFLLSVLLLALAAEDAAVLSWHGLAPADRASDTALRRAAAFWPERLAARRLMEARLYALACDSL